MNDTGGNNIIAGDKSHFAVEISPESNEDGWVYGTVLVWANGRRFGNPDEPATICGCLSWMKHILEDSEIYHSQEYFDLPLKTIDSQMGDFEATDCRDYHFHIEQMGMSSFYKYGDNLIFIKNETGKERIICKSDVHEIQDIFLEPNGLENIFKDVIKQYDAMPLPSPRK